MLLLFELFREAGARLPKVVDKPHCRWWTYCRGRCDTFGNHQSYNISGDLHFDDIDVHPSESITCGNDYRAADHDFDDIHDFRYLRFYGIPHGAHFIFVNLRIIRCSLLVSHVAASVQGYHTFLIGQAVKQIKRRPKALSTKDDTRQGEESS